MLIASDDKRTHEAWGIAGPPNAKIHVAKHNVLWVWLPASGGLKVRIEIPVTSRNFISTVCGVDESKVLAHATVTPLKSLKVFGLGVLKMMSSSPRKYRSQRRSRQKISLRCFSHTRLMV